MFFDRGEAQFSIEHLAPRVELEIWDKSIMFLQGVPRSQLIVSTARLVSPNGETRTVVRDNQRGAIWYRSLVLDPVRCLGYSNGAGLRTSFTTGLEQSGSPGSVSFH